MLLDWKRCAALDSHILYVPSDEEVLSVESPKLVLRNTCRHILFQRLESCSSVVLTQIRTFRLKDATARYEQHMRDNKWYRDRVDNKMVPCLGTCHMYVCKTKEVITCM